MEAVLFGINLFIAYLIWSQVWRRTALDHYRDQLFDLRDEVREYFTERGLPLDHPIYIRLRVLLNGHLRYTEQLTLRSYLATTSAMTGYPEVARRLREEVEKQFETDDKELGYFVKRVRSRAVAILLGYMGETSFVLVLLSALVWPVAVLVRLFRWFAGAMSTNQGRLKAGVWTVFRLATLAGLAVAMPARAGWVDKAFDGNIVEEYSYQANLH